MPPSLIYLLPSVLQGVNGWEGHIGQASGCLLSVCCCGQSLALQAHFAKCFSVIFKRRTAEMQLQSLPREHTHKEAPSDKCAGSRVGIKAALSSGSSLPFVSKFIRLVKE